MKVILRKAFILFVSISLLTPTLFSAAEMTESIESRTSKVLNVTNWRLDSNSCDLFYSFLQNCSGDMTITLQKENSSGKWIKVVSQYHSFSFRTAVFTEIPVKNLSAGVYRIKTEIYAIAGTPYEETQYTESRRLY